MNGEEKVGNIVLQPVDVPQLESVDATSEAIAKALEAMPKVTIRGKISGFGRAAKGNCYFQLEGTKTCIRAVAYKKKIKLEKDLPDGMNVIAVGRIEAYPAHSNYQLIVEQLFIVV